MKTKIKKFAKKIVKALSIPDIYETQPFGECRLVCHPAYLNLSQPYFWF